MNKKELKKYIVAFTIGDGYLSKIETENSNSYFKTTLKSKHFDLIKFQGKILGNLTTYKIFSYISTKCTELRTKVHPIYTNLRKRMYNKDGNRILDPYIIKTIDEESLALIYMFDGSLTKYKRKNNSIYLVLKLSTHSYSYYDNLALSNYIRNKFNINFKVQTDYDKRYNKRYTYLLCRQNEALKFLKITKKFKLQSFNYKWDVETTN